MMNRRMKAIMGEDEMPDFAVEAYEQAKQKGSLPKKKVEYEAFMVTPQERAMIEAMRKRKQSPEEMMEGEQGMGEDNGSSDFA
jgi:hypothetical protein